MNNCTNNKCPAYAKCTALFYDSFTCRMLRASYDEADAVEVVRCKYCIHKPRLSGDLETYVDGFDIIFPDDICPCHCEDGYYSWMPKDDWFCANGERKENSK